MNDLPLDNYCEELGRELDTLMSNKAAEFYEQVMKGKDNKPLWPLSEGEFGEWSERSEKDIRSALKAKVMVGAGSRLSESSSRMQKPLPIIDP